MKTITIPRSFGYPTVDIVVNNIRYTVKSGEEVTIDDHVAEVIENAIALAPKYARNLSKFAQRVEGSISEVNNSDLEGISTIYSYSFYNCDSLTDIEIPNSVKIVGGFAFAYCENLAKVVLPESVMNIDGRAFAESYNLTRVILKARIPPTMVKDTVEYIPKTCIFEVPLESIEVYKNAESWSKIANQIVAIKE